ncbi:MAG: hypothetical protein NT030_08200 [Candidatus Saganbacteria bacterium]|nr:hypothetical protein [Candidatus Saganbacteria bacterium]
MGRKITIAELIKSMKPGVPNPPGSPEAPTGPVPNAKTVAKGPNTKADDYLVKLIEQDKEKLSGNVFIAKTNIQIAINNAKPAQKKALKAYIQNLKDDKLKAVLQSLTVE